MPSRALLSWSTVLLSLLLLTACGEEKKPYAWQLPPGFPEPFVPADNPMSEEKVALGRFLFYDERLSGNGTQACASCHFPELGYVVVDAHPINDSGKPTSRKSQPLIGLGHASKALVGWDGRSATLEDQAKASIATGSRR